MIKALDRGLNPLACGIAAGLTELIFALIIGFPMFGMGMMGESGGMMAGYGFAVLWWLGGALIAALGGAVFAGIYNAVNRE